MIVPQTPTLYIDIHALQTLPPSNVNRDDSGAPKTATYGGVTRSRVSSQSWKKAIRDHFKESSNPNAAGLRSRWVAKEIAEEIQKVSPEISDKDAYDLGVKALSYMGAKPNKKREEESDVFVFLSRKQIEAVAELMVLALDEKDKVREAKIILNKHNAFDMSLFGRMVASEAGYNIEAAVQYAHALGINALTPEFDFWSATDDVGSEKHSGSGNIGNFEFNSSTYYRFCSINTDTLVENLGTTGAARMAVEEFLQAFVHAVPSGKQNSFAALTRPSLLVVHIRDSAPVSYAPAFETPVSRTRDKSITEVGAEKMAEYAQKLEDSFDLAPIGTWVVSLNDVEFPNATYSSLDSLINDIKELAFDSDEVE